MKQWIPFILLTLFTLTGLDAQLVTDLPQVSSKCKVVQTVGLTDIALMYSSPAVNERKIWGELVPYDQMWRAGANENTVFYASDDIEIEGTPLKAGKYGMHMIPGEDNFVIIFSNEHTAWGSYNYDPSEEALRVEVKPRKTELFRENLNFSFDNVTAESATCMLHWGEIMVPFQLKVNTHEVVLASLREELKTRAGFSWIGWNEAANYCLQNNINLQEASAWAGRSVFMQPNPQNLVTKAQLAGMAAGEGEDQKMVMIKTLDADLKAHPVTWKDYQAAANFALNTAGDNAKAMEWIDKSISMDANMTNRMVKVAMLENAGETKEAAKLKEKAIASGSNSELNTYGYTLLFAGKTGEAVQIFKANADKNPNDPNAWDSLGEGYMNNGQKEEAVKALKKSLSMNPPENVKANSIKLLGQMGVEYKTGT